MAPVSRPIGEFKQTEAGTFPVGTRGVLIERLIATPGHRGGHRERVDYVSTAVLASQLRKLPAGRFRVTCIGSRGCIAGGTRVVEVSEGEPLRPVPARTPKDYVRTPTARKKTRLRAKFKAARARVRSATHEKHAAKRKLTRRDARIAQERETRVQREEVLRVELRTARRAARVATRGHAQALDHAERQERARNVADQRADAEALARAAADAEVARLRTELEAARTAARNEPVSRPKRPRSAQPTAMPNRPTVPRLAAEVPRAPRGLRRRRPPPVATPLQVPPSVEEVRLRELLARRDAEHAAMQAYIERVEGTLASALAQRNAARAEATRRKEIVELVAWAVGGAGVLALAVQGVSATRSRSTDTMPSAGLTPRAPSLARGVDPTIARASATTDSVWGAGAWTLRALGGPASGPARD